LVEQAKEIGDEDTQHHAAHHQRQAVFFWRLDRRILLWIFH
jgi:hypothetical protein